MSKQQYRCINSCNSKDLDTHLRKCKRCNTNLERLCGKCGNWTSAKNFNKHQCSIAPCAGIERKPYMEYLVHCDGNIYNHNGEKVAIQVLNRLYSPSCEEKADGTCNECISMWRNRLRFNLFSVKSVISGEVSVLRIKITEFDNSKFLVYVTEEYRKLLKQANYKIRYQKKKLEEILLLGDMDQKQYLLNLMIDVLSGDFLKEDSFLFQYLCNTFENIQKPVNQRKYKDEILRFWLVIKYYGGKRL